MARIFYRADGTIYGVHPGSHEGNKKIRLPEGVTWIDVPEQPHEIAWPTFDGQPGTEQTSLIDKGKLKAKNNPPPENKKAKVEKMLKANGLTLADLKTALASDNN